MLYRNYGGKVALRLGGEGFTTYIALNSRCPTVEVMQTKYFVKEYSVLISRDFEAACWSMLKCAKQAHTHSKAVISILRSKVMNKPLSEMSLDALVVVYNQMAVALDKKPRKQFDNRAKVIEAIGQLDEQLSSPTKAQTQAESSAVKTVKHKERSMSDDTKPRGKGIGARAIELILEGKTNAEVIERVKAEIEGSNPTPATMAWYRNKLRKEGKLAKTERKVNGSEAVTTATE